MGELLDFVSVTAVISIGIISILIQIWLAKKENERRISEENRKQKQILNSIDVLKLEISIAMEGQLEELNKNVVPSYFIPSVNAFYYISRLNSRIDGKDTFVLKQILMKLENKIININRLIELIQNAAVIPNPDTYRQFVSELKKTPGYYEDLKQLLDLLKN